MSQPAPSALYRDEFIIPESAIDENGHVNNVVFVQWMQDVATRHFEAAGGRAAMQVVGGAWVVRSHQVEYLSPAFAGEHVQAVTWVTNFNRALSLRRYRFLRDIACCMPGSRKCRRCTRGTRKDLLSLDECPSLTAGTSQSLSIPSKTTGAGATVVRRSWQE